MTLPVYIYGHPVLRKVSAEIDQNYPDLAKLIQNMKDKQRIIMLLTL